MYMCRDKLVFYIRCGVGPYYMPDTAEADVSLE